MTRSAGSGACRRGALFAPARTSGTCGRLPDSPTRRTWDARRLAMMFWTIDECPKPVVAKVQGAAMGGGAGLLAVADVVVADSEARFAFSEIRLGIAPATISPFVVRKIGVSHAILVPHRRKVRRRNGRGRSASYTGSFRATDSTKQSKRRLELLEVRSRRRP